MFKTKLRKVSELVREIRKKDERIEELNDEITRLRKHVATLLAAEDDTPSDCKRGAWCRGCEFCKVVHVPGNNWGSYDAVYFCGKGESCQNFVQKEV